MSLATDTARPTGASVPSAPRPTSAFYPEPHVTHTCARNTSGFHQQLMHASKESDFENLVSKNH